MAITQDDFKKVWASTSSVPQYTFSDTDYKNGWEFVGNLPPTRAMWDELQRKNDEKMQFLQENGSMCFDSVADMKSSNLDAGQTAFTKGYYSINDGGAGIYTIRAMTASDVEDGGSIIFLSNGNVAELITDGTVNVRQFGAKGDGITDDTTAIQSALNSFDHVVVPFGEYIVSVTETKQRAIQPRSNCVLDIYGTLKLLPNSLSAYSIIYVGDVSNVEVNFYGGLLLGDKDTHTGSTGEYGHCLYIAGATNCRFNGVVAQNGWGDGINIGKSDINTSQNITLVNCTTIGNRRNGFTVTACDGAYIYDCSFTNSGGTAPGAGFDIEPNADDVVKVYLDNIRCYNNTYAFSLSNSYSSNYYVHIGTIECKLNGIGISLMVASTVEIDEFVGDFSNVNIFYFRNVSSAKINIGKAIFNAISSAIAGIFLSSGTVGKITIGELVITGDVTKFASNTDGYAIDIGTMLIDGIVSANIFYRVFVRVGTILTPKRTITTGGLVSAFFIDDATINNEGTSLITITTEPRAWVDGEVFHISNVSTTGSARLATSTSEQLFVKEGTASNALAIPNGASAIVRYNKTLNKAFVLFMG